MRINKIFDNPFLYNAAQALLAMDFYKVASYFLRRYPHRSIVEIGCGTGEMLKHLDPERYVGVDINKNYIKTARRKFNRGNFEFLVADGNSIKSKEKFDILLMVNIIHHISDNDLSEM